VDDDEKAQIRRDAGEAAYILEHPIYKQAWEGIRAQVISDLEQEYERTAEQNARLILKLQVLGQLRDRLEQVFITGKFENAIEDTT